jgi:hypothetical protein
MTTKITPSVLANTTVTASTYGTADKVSTLTVDAQGRVTGASNTSIAIGTTQITSGTLADDRLPGQGSLTAANYYGSASSIAQIVTDAKGRIKSAANVTIAIASSAVSGLATVATSGSYLDLSNRPSVPAAQVNSDWNAASGVAQILNKPSLFDGNYNSLSNKPTIPTNTNQLTNGAGFLTSAATATAGIGDIMGLYNKSLVPQGTITFYRTGQEVAGSDLFYISGDGYNTTGNPGTRYSYNNKTGIAFEEVIFSAYWNAYNASPLSPWTMGLPAGRSVVTVSGTWRAIRPNLYSVYTVDYAENGVSYESFCNLGLWQRIS